MENNGRILALGAHPDDVEFMCAGTLILLKKAGYEITIVTMAPGDCGSVELSAEKISVIRKAEAAKAAEVIGARYFCLEERDLAMDYDTRTRRRVVSAVREVDPFVILTHPPVDYMVDHEVTSRLVRDACFCAGIPNFAGTGGEPRTAGIPYLFYFDPVDLIDHSGNRVAAEFVVDITKVFEAKNEMLKCHASQREWLLKHHGVDEYTESQKRWSSIRGADIGAEYGEGFRQYRGHAYPHDNVLLEMVQQ
ncbi:MAG: LmbE family protein [Armatimonadetes bacterium CG2_30_59_28]|nr:PIG-L family deacetylase [Armatimonadota bacterium]OIO96079.1 MAG: LmbE family protein [Armatimonadetes bacterium CG2_30_59_28]PIU65641.1 MAG: LmbE family protein [Armatimonadetes bacterium CG07_land_8_20_14_0_80_59_28]PIX44066.1 MAG: LmbE family protein [Armatimonadetes bacterium CG_4_8_14_3_um_filter_58_9]PIY42536.1 MAG: LmbE family protein [Armatimonadetes bacterium CG_4_10_14_3_um_filter_59_10]PJB65488.1 MAG: LmbE family protein [Armatimonadetes bacterium CG_4_9_14_3_um_filter_58_7]